MHDKVDKIIQLQEKTIKLQEQLFFNDVLFSFQWWILVLISIFLWVIWSLVVDKSRLQPILLFGLIISLLAVVLDDIGYSLTWWHYPYNLIYITNILIPIDMTVIPVSYMLLYQFFGTWKSFLIALSLDCLFAAFVIEPIFSKLEIYLLLHWEFWYSVPIYLVMGVFAKWLVDKIGKITLEK
ncbi:CBO0543 family protein [Metabacillus arenae]|uniref:Uncharacterized protein n=1 Tax=Metabacillus arenae TaxID=2771434 RepID=A0A926NKE1_9BACI|nr:CBO0543 family protein [Metabacillus arenae]MBD1382961.1 hypothetical protein [Metabacillus arenae]